MLIPKKDFAKVVAVGDPQTTFSRFHELLDRNDLLAVDGNLRPDTHLVVLGDYFDFGGTEQRSQAAADGLSILRWLAAHEPAHVTLIAGNHDLARVGELVAVSNERFDAAHAEARVLYPEPFCEANEARFFERYPEFATTESVARDFSAYVVEQRELVIELLLQKRLRLAASMDNLLFCHAGVTSADLRVLGLSTDQPNAQEAAATMNLALDELIAIWPQDRPFVIPGFHTPGSSKAGEGGGALFHRPAQPRSHLDAFSGPRRRRYDPRGIPMNIVQVVGHVRDKKCRELLADWVVDPPPESEGAIRGLVTDGKSVSYRLGRPEIPSDHGGIVFLDGGMNEANLGKYEVLEVWEQDR